MKVVPAVDLRGGRCVQLVGGSYDHQAIERDDPVAVAVQWESEGFACLHVVDLDAATGRGSNGDAVGQILDSVGMSVQVGGGIRSTDSVQRMLDRGAAKVVVGTRAIEDHEWAASVARRYPEAIIVAADVRGRTVVTHGWDASGGRGIEEELDYFNTLPLGGLLVTAVHVEGLMQGPDLDLMKDVVAQSRHLVQASGGITTIADLHALDTLGVGSAIVGMALYTGALSVTDINEEWKR